MRARILFSFFTALFSTQLWATPQNFKVDIQHWQTSNGAKVFFVQAPEVPMLDINLVFSAGSSHDGELPGLAEFTARMLGEGTKKLSVYEIAKRFENVGAHFGADASWDMGSLSLRSLSDDKYLTPALDTLQQVLTEPSFPKGRLKEIKDSTLLSLQRQTQTPGGIAYREFIETVYKGTPYQHLPLGTTESVKKIERKNLKAFYQKYYVAKNLVITMVGDISRKKAAVIAKQLTATLPAGEAATNLTKIDTEHAGTTKRINFPSSQASIIIGQPALQAQSNARYAMALGNHILGGNMSSRLFKNVRDQHGLAYSIYSTYQPLKYKGPFFVHLESRDAKKSLAVTKNTLIEFIQKGPSDTELADAKRSLTGSFPIKISNNSSILNVVTAIGFYQLPLNYLNTYIDSISAVSKSDLINTLQQHLDPDTMTTIIVGGNGHQTS